MKIESVHDRGQMLPIPEGKVYGIIDSPANFEAFTDSLQRAGYPPEKITSVHGEEGLALLKRLKEHSFFFGDGEDRLIKRSMHELEDGHFVVAVDVHNRDEALHVVELARGRGHSFGYFGRWINEELTG